MPESPLVNITIRAEPDGEPATRVGGRHDPNLLFRMIGEWGDVTFPHSTDHSKLTHLQKELDELKADPSNGEEMADVLHLLAQLAHAHHINLWQATAVKFAINRQRRWQAPDADGVVEHVRD